MEKLYTIGYGNLTNPTQLADLCDALGGAVVMDVRMSPVSKNENWRKAHLEWVFSQPFRQGEYVHVPEFGNANYKGQLGRGIILKAPGRGVTIAKKLIKDRPVLAMCACDAYSFCHRKEVANLLVEKLECDHLEIRRPTSFLKDLCGGQGELF